MTREERKANRYKLTAEEKLEIVRLYESGMTILEISKQFIISMKRVSQILTDNNQRIKNSKFTESEKLEILKLHQIGYKIYQIAKKIKRNNKVIGRFLKESNQRVHGYALNLDEKAEIVKLYQDGMSILNIRKKFHIGENSVYKILKNNNQKIRRKNSLTEIEKLEIINLYKNGVKIEELCKKFKKTDYKIYETLDNANIPRKRRNQNLIGLRFGRLVVIGKNGKTKSRNTKWECQCDCGNIKHTIGTRLNNGTVRSCGCLQKEWASQKFTTHALTKTTKYSMYCDAKKRAKKLNLPFNLNLEDIIIPEYCPIFSDIKLEANIGQPKYNSPSLDRLVPLLGYIRGNVKVISMKANMLKTNASFEELRQIADWIEQELKNK